MDKKEPKMNKNRRHIGWLLLSLFLAGAALWDQFAPEPVIVQSVRESQEPEELQASLPGPPDRFGREGDRPDPDQAEKFPVYLVGAVRNPGIYHVLPGTYLYELVDQAGGLTAEAAKEEINLVAVITQNQMIRLPTKAEISAGHRFDLPDANASGNRLIDLNRADQADFESLPGIGPATARPIIAFREENGPFTHIEDLMKVPGIKEARFKDVKDLVMVSG